MPDALDRLKAALANRYVLEREIGSGGMATVYLARDAKHEHQVADIRVLDLEYRASKRVGSCAPVVPQMSRSPPARVAG